MAGHDSYRRAFAISVLILEVIIVFFYGFCVRGRVHNDANFNSQWYPMYQDVNVMMLIGFGFLMTFIHSYSWSALAYTFFINAIVVQLYILLNGFWHKVFHGGWGSQIQIDEKTLTSASYCVAAVLISFGAVLGRLGAFELLIMAVIQCIGYTLNEKIVYEWIKTLDVGGSTAIHTYGAYFGLTVSLLIGRLVKPTKKCQTSYNSNIFAFIGTLFLWMYWPSFNAGYFPTSQYQKTIIITNTVISLTGSCLSTFAMTSLLREKFSMEDILNATLSGGVIIGASAGLLTNPGGSLILGLAGGVISTLGYNFLTSRLEDSISLYDTCGVHNLHGMPGLLGGLSSAVVIAAYGSSPLNSASVPYLAFSSLDFNKQGGFQVAGTFCSLGIGIAFGIIVGFLLRIIYIFESNQFYDDRHYFEVPVENKQQIRNENDETMTNLRTNQNKSSVQLSPLKKVPKNMIKQENEQHQ